MLEIQPSRVYRGTWEELMRHQEDIPPRAVLELRVYEPPSERDIPVVDAENVGAIAQLRAWSAEEATNDPQAVRQAETDLKELLQSLDANRIAAGERPLIP